jgi:cytochrome P450
MPTDEDAAYGAVYRVAADGMRSDVLHARLAELHRAAPVREGSLADLLPWQPFGRPPTDGAPTYTRLSWETCDVAFREKRAVLVRRVVRGNNDKVLVTIVGERHRRYRMLLQPAFLKRSAETRRRST